MLPSLSLIGAPPPPRPYGKNDSFSFSNFLSNLKTEKFEKEKIIFIKPTYQFLLSLFVFLIFSRSLVFLIPLGILLLLHF